MARIGAAPPGLRFSRTLITFVATGAFIGYAPAIPGTVGSVIGLFLVRFAAWPVWRYSPGGFLIGFGLMFIGGCSVADRAERILAEPDSSLIVIDEILGMVATMFGNSVAWPWLIAGFALFRLFDIIKPWPASWFDRMRGGAGIMLDDLAAAFYANISLQVLRRII
jgi:phosphatidylglycerophosphatase A